jgi:predicted DNA-binding transcriptional regulator AlpA
VSAGVEEKAERRRVGTGTAMEILGKTRSQIYRYIESGDLTPVNTLPPNMTKGKKKHTYEFYLDDLQRLAALINPKRR